MAATAARSSFMNPQQFKDRIPYQTPIIAVNLPRRRCTSNDKRPLQLNDGAIEGPRRLPVAYQRSLPDDDSVNMEVDFWISGLDDPLLADLVTKKRKWFSSLVAEANVDVAKPKKEDPLWADLVSESKLRDKLEQEYKDAKKLYMLQRKSSETSKEDFEKNFDTTIKELNSQGQQYSPVVSKWMDKYGVLDTLYKRVPKELYDHDFRKEWHTIKMEVINNHLYGWPYSDVVMKWLIKCRRISRISGRRCST